MRVVDLIEKTFNKEELTKKEIEFLIDGFVTGEIKDYQMSAWAMAVRAKGLTNTETTLLTLAMMESGQVWDLSSIKGIKVDKHSTGGVGDKVSIILGPVVAAMGIPMAKMSGRGLGHTGGTIDKLESIDGFKISLTEKQMIEQVKNIGLAIVSQTETIVPADKKLYALRDVTATTESLELIAASVMSKKLATGADAILLDIKVGNGAFMKTIEQATKLGNICIALGEKLKRKVKVEITSMQRPLGQAIGNKIEIIEAYNVLKNNSCDDIKAIVIAAASELAVMAGKFKDIISAEKEVIKVINSGIALEKFREWINVQGGDISELEKGTWFEPKYKIQIKATSSGFMNITSAKGIGIIAMKLGAGRQNKNDILDNDASIWLDKKTGNKVSKGDVVMTLYSSKVISKILVEELKQHYNILKTKPQNKLVLKKLG